MPKYSREMEDKIIALFEQGKRNSVISRELSIYRGALPSRRKEWEKRKQEQEKPETEPEKTIQQDQNDSHPLDPKIYTRTGGVALSDSAISRLYQIHELIGANSVEEMLETVYSDYVVADRLWLEYKEYPSANVTKTFAWVIAQEKAYAADLKHDLDIYMNGFQEDHRLKEELEAEAEKQYDEGYQKGKNDYALLVPCTSCGQPITLTPGTETHRHIVEFCRELRIIHNDCIPKYKRIYVP